MSEILVDRDPCPCGSGRRIVDCCVRSCGWLLPPAPLTLFMNQRCYARRTRDCSTKLTREHAVSAGILSIMAARGPIRVSGLPRQPVGEVKLLTPQALASKILCKRHNESLSPLDALGKRFFGSFPHISPSQTSADEQLRLFQGHDLERWMLKTMCGAICSRYVAGPAMPPPEWQPSVELLKVLLLGAPLVSPAGLYFRANTGETIDPRPRVEVTLLANTQEPQGIAILLHGFEFFLALEAPAESFLASTQYRPNGLEFNTPHGKTSLLFYWAESHYGATANITFVPK